MISGLHPVWQMIDTRMAVCHSVPVRLDIFTKTKHNWLHLARRIFERLQCTFEKPMRTTTHLVSGYVEGAFPDIRCMFEGVLDEGVDSLEARILNGLVRVEAHPEEATRRRYDRRKVAPTIFSLTQKRGVRAC